MFELTEEQRMLRGAVRRMAEEEIAPRAAEIDETMEFPWDIKEAIQEMGLFGIIFPNEYGGSGPDQLSLCLAVEEIARVCVSSSLMLQVQALGATPILIAGSDEQKAEYCPPLASGEKLCAFGFTEPGAGSDLAVIATRAVLHGDTYIINGRKCFISGGNVADTLVIFASTDPEARHRGTSAFIVEKGFPGFGIGKIENKMGIRASPAVELLFDDCEVPRENLLGGEGEGFSIGMKTFDESRTVIAAQAVGLAQGALDFAIEYAKERVQFGAPIAKLEGIEFLLAEMAAQVEAARYLTYKAASLVGRDGRELSYLAAAAKLVASDAAMRVTTDAVQVAGGYGYMKDFPLERMMRDAKITQIYEGTNQVMKLVMARRYLLSDRRK
ncbi:MAG: acyl-CoA dehydrogenase family protein [Anaerolineae bacterium]